MKNSIDTIGNRTRDFPACSTLPQPTVPLCAHNQYIFCIDATVCLAAYFILSYIFFRAEV